MSTPDLSSLLFTRASLALSRTQRLVSTWLPPPTAEELARASNSTETEREQDEIFMPTTELSGLGAKYTAEDEKEAMTVRSDEKLRIQLMGKDWKRPTKKGDTGKSPLSVGVEKRLSSKEMEPELSSGDEAGRSSLGKAKARMAKARHSGHDGIDDSVDAEAKVSRASGRAKAVNYLDEVLAEREQKRVRKKNMKA